MTIYSPEVIAQMRKDMEVVFKMFALNEAARKVATASALGRVNAASKCYRAIAHSLTPTVERGVDAAVSDGRASGESAAGKLEENGNG